MLKLTRIGSELCVPGVNALMRRLLQKGPELLQVNMQENKKTSLEEKRRTLFMHYALPSDNLPMLARVGAVDVAMFAFRCGACEEDFHIGVKPNFCPNCGQKFEQERAFGEKEAA